jgi:DNA repair protein RecO (recombination protein O)
VKRTVRRVTTDALLLRAVEYGEADVIATFLGEAEGRISVIARGARKGTARLGGALEPFHTVRVGYDDRGTDVATLKEAAIKRVRLGLAQDLDALDAAGRALRWVRHVCPPKTPEPGVFAEATDLLDRIDREPRAAGLALAAFGLRLLGEAGYGLELDRCIRCAKPCPDDRPSAFDTTRGGLLCRACGGGGFVLKPAARAAARALARGEALPGPITPDITSTLIDLVDASMAAHTGYEA